MQTPIQTFDLAAKPREQIIAVKNHALHFAAMAEPGSRARLEALAAYDQAELALAAIL